MRSPDAVAPEFVAKVEAGRLIAQVIFYVIATYDRNLLQSEKTPLKMYLHLSHAGICTAMADGR